MTSRIKILVSSTWLDLQPERQAVEFALHRMKSTEFVGMEYFGSRPNTPLAVSLAEVDRCDLYVGIIAGRYGSGITEHEYHRALDRNLPCFIYLKQLDADVPSSDIELEPDKQARLQALIKEMGDRHIWSEFKNPDQLATQVVADIHNFLLSGTIASEIKPQRVFYPGFEQRMGDLAHHIYEDLQLLREYEDLLRIEDDPKRILRYRREIDRLKESASKYKAEYRNNRRYGSYGRSETIGYIEEYLNQLDALLFDASPVRGSEEVD